MEQEVATVATDSCVLTAYSSRIDWATSRRFQKQTVLHCHVVPRSQVFQHLRICWCTWFIISVEGKLSRSVQSIYLPSSMLAAFSGMSTESMQNRCVDILCWKLAIGDIQQHWLTLPHFESLLVSKSSIAGEWLSRWWRSRWPLSIVSKERRHHSCWIYFTKISILFRGASWPPCTTQLINLRISNDSNANDVQWRV